ncbi:hypothetical protein AMATHDRAFT_59054 [Amanita thiersii Skay4041]|uniref:DNA repair protein Rad26 n=1 Tax=Amanita thiersii Skay4041 TaxID=703135 RepID=A0A2A9NTH1_9AGAR|nr:hypothetical protein AMATHDRAFT_59054 [Amanita thiersii Skay4041]
MDDSDDYIVDDITLDDETLALLDNEEQKFLSTTTQGNLLLDPPPVNKKRKTDSGWEPGPGTRLRAGNEIEDLPEISVQADGTYSVHDPVRDQGPLYGRMQYAVPVMTPSMQQSFVRTPRNPTSLPLRTVQRRTVKQSGESDFEENLNQLNRQLEQLHQENQRVKNALKEVTDKKLLKEGEVTVLRMSIEKTAQEHAAQVATLKAAKDEADARRLQMQKEMKEEIERMKTQLLFKQQEIETSIRRLQSANRSNKPPDASQTAAFQRTTQPSHWESSRQDIFVTETESVVASRVKPRTKANESLKDRNLPGFQNAFTDSSLSRSNKAIEQPPSTPILPSQPSSPAKPSGVLDQVDSEHTQECIMNDIFEDTYDIPLLQRDEQSGVLPVISVDWGKELMRMIFSHTSPGIKEPTMQLLLATTIPPHTNRVLDYSSATSGVLSILATSASPGNYAKLTETMCDFLSRMLDVLCDCEFRQPMCSLLNLLTFLILSLPDFVSHLICEATDSQRFKCLNTISKIITSQIKLDLSQFDRLAEEVFTFLETTCLLIPNDMMARLSPLVQNVSALETLLMKDQPIWLVSRSCRLLVLFSTHATLAPILLTVRGTSAPDNANPINQHAWSLVDRLSYLLQVTNDPFDQTVSDRVLTVFAALSVSCSDNLTMLTDNYTVIPSLVCFLSDLIAPLWEEDEALAKSPDRTMTLIHATHQAVLLIHYLVFSTEPSLNIRLRLHHNPYRSHTGLHHVYIVCFSRLSYADPPEWVDATGRRELEALAEMARELLDLVVDGPESDSIWSLYQQNPNQEEKDEGELEAHLLGD